MLGSSRMLKRVSGSWRAAARRGPAWAGTRGAIVDGGQGTLSVFHNGEHVLRMDVAANCELWSHLTMDPEAQEGQMCYFDASHTGLVRIEGSRSGFFEVGWLEGRRAQRHLYAVEWTAASSAKAQVGI